MPYDFDDLRQTPDAIDAPSADWEDMEAQRRLPRLLMKPNATQAIKAAGTAYLPMWEKESDKEYARRIADSSFVNYYGETVRDFADLMYREPLQTESLPESTERVWENVDGQGLTGDLFSKDRSEESIGEGISHIFVDFPSLDLQGADGRPVTRQEEQQSGERLPVWKAFGPYGTIEAMPVVVDREEVLGRVRYVDVEDVPDGTWGSRREYVIKAYYRGDPDATPDSGERFMRHELWRLADDEWVLDEKRSGSVVPPLSAPKDIRDRFIDIPLVPIYTVKEGFFKGYPQLGTMAELNATDWRKRSNKDNTLAVASVPMKFFAGFSREEVALMEWGPFRAAFHPEPDRHVDDIAHDVASVEIAIRDLEDLRSLMAFLARQPILSQATGDEKVTIRLVDEAKRMSRIQAWALSHMNGINTALAWTSWWMGTEHTGEVSIKKEVFDVLNSVEAFEMTLKMLDREIPIRDSTVLRMAQGVNAFPDDIEPEEEVRKAREEAEANQPPELRAALSELGTGANDGDEGADDGEGED